MNKYHLITLEEVNGEYESNIDMMMAFDNSKISLESALHQACLNWRDAQSQDLPSDGWYEDGELAWQISSYKEMPKSDFDVCSRYFYTLYSNL